MGHDTEASFNSLLWERLWKRKWIDYVLNHIHFSRLLKSWYNINKYTEYRIYQGVFDIMKSWRIMMGQGCWKTQKWRNVTQKWMVSGRQSPMAPSLTPIPYTFYCRRTKSTEITAFLKRYSHEKLHTVAASTWKDLREDHCEESPFGQLSLANQNCHADWQSSPQSFSLISLSVGWIHSIQPIRTMAL